MNGIEASLLELLGIAETPVYAAYRWLGRELGRQLSMDEFLRLVDRLAQADALRLWAVDPQAERRERLLRVPEGLARDYASSGHNDETFDPYALSITLGANADLTAAPDWKVDFDFEAGQFALDVKLGAEQDALKELRRLFPDLELVEGGRDSADPEHLRIFGAVSLNDADSGI